MKKFSFILYMLLSFPIAAYSYTAKIDGIYYDFNGQKAVVTYQNSNGTLDYSGTIVIPMSVTYNGRIYSVTSIGSSAFYGCDGLTSITIPESVTSIGYSAFYNCSGLTSITIPESVTNIGHLAFSGCSGLQKVIVPDIAAWCNISFFGITGSSNPLFYACHLFYDEDTEITDLVIPDGVTSINDYAFVNCSDIASVTIPESVTAIGTSAFSGCHFSSDSFVNNSLLTHSGNWGATLYDEDTKDGLLINSNIVVRCRSWATNVTIPEDVTTIGNEAFSGCSCLTSVSIPESVTAIGDEVFSGCSGLTSVAIPESVTTIGSKAFNGCSSLTSVAIPESVTAIGISAFAGCHFTSDSFVNNSSLTSNDNWGATLYDLETNDGLLIKNGVVVKCRLWATSVTISNDITRISSDAFSNCNGLLLVILNNKKLVSARRDSGTSLGSIFGNQVEEYVIGESVTGIGSCAFSGCSGLISVTIPTSVTSIGDYAFSGCCGLTSITIPNSVTSISDGAFSGCSSLASISIPNSVTTIGKYVFQGCGLQKVIVPDIAAWCKISFVDGDYAYSNPLVYVHHLFSDEETEITSLVIPDGVTSIRSGTFRGCSGLTSIAIPESVTSIGRDAFYGCSGLTSIAIPESVTSIGSYAFSGCSGLISVTIPTSVTSIGSSAFRDCSGLKKVIIPDLAAWCGIKFMDSLSNPLYYAHHLFSDVDTEITDLVIPEGVASIGSSAFYGCNGLTSVVIPESVTCIGNYAFSDCSGLTSITIPKSITSISSSAIPNGMTIYTSTGKHLLTLWNAGYKNIKETRSGRDLGIPVISSDVTKSSSSNLSIENYYHEFSYAVQMSNVSRTIERKDTCFSGLDPDTQYSMELSVTSDDVTYTSNTISFKTAVLTLTTRQPRVVSSGNVVLAAESNLDDKETKVGFEWRRIDWTDDFFSNNCGAYLYEGTMESYIRNLYYMEHTLWKYRPYYESNLGNRYYGEWVGIDPTNTNYYEPSVHTYTTINVEGNTAEVEGYAMRGSDNIFKQGFMYWKKDSNAKSIPANAMTVEAKGNQMFATLENLDYDTEYCYVAFVTTSENETFYGKEQTFKTDLSQDMIDGIVETNNVQSSGSNVHSIYDLNGRKLSAPQKGINIIHMSDGARRKVMIM